MSPDDIFAELVQGWLQSLTLADLGGDDHE